MNLRDEALKIFKKMEARYRDHYLPPSNLAIVAAALGKDEYALKLAHTCLDIIDPYFPFIGPFGEYHWLVLPARRPARHESFWREQFGRVSESKYARNHP